MNQNLNVKSTDGIAKPLRCPCCQQWVAAPSIDIIRDHYGLDPMQTRILEAVWKGKGLPVQTPWIFNAMYADDPDGGPSPPAMYNTFKVTLCHLRKRLDGSGIGITNVGKNRGYRLTIEAEAQS